jgi:3-isopropylmalate dehydrogenase
VRTQLDLYANARPARTRPGLPAKGGTFDLVIMREATEGFYPDRNMFAGRAEFMTDPDTALSIRKITRKASERIARRAYELAMKRRRKVTLIHKANTFRLSDGLFLEACRDVARDFPEVETDAVIVDAMAALLVRQPERYDVICATNFHADILSDLASELSGSLGLAGSVNAGDDLCCAQAQHGSAPDIAGQDKANPTSLILSAALLLDWLAEKRGLAACGAAARAIEAAIDAALARPETRTADLGGALGTRAFAGQIAAALAG